MSVQVSECVLCMCVCNCPIKTVDFVWRNENRGQWDMKKGLISGSKVAHKAKFTVEVYSITSRLQLSCQWRMKEFCDTPLRSTDTQLYIFVLMFMTHLFGIFH